jgi:hypothetical protein
MWKILQNSSWNFIYLSNPFFGTKIIILIPGNHRSCLFIYKPLYFILFMFQPLEFYKNIPEVVQKYILAPTILHLGP